MTGLLSRLGLGLLGGAAAAYAAFGPTIFQPLQPAFENLLLAVVAAAMLALAGRDLVAEALALIPLFGLARLAYGGGSAWRLAFSAVLVAGGMFIVALVYRELGRCGIRFGRFLVVGPLLGGVCLAVAPLSEYTMLNTYDAFRPLMLQLFSGIVVGDGAGLGVELAELFAWGDDQQLPQASGAAAATDEGRSSA